MPYAPARPCTYPGCPTLVSGSGARCARHPHPSAAARGYGYQWQQARAKVLRDQPCCMQCGAVATEVHHIVPITKGGTHERGNLVALCHACHASVGRSSSRKLS